MDEKELLRRCVAVLFWIIMLNDYANHLKSLIQQSIIALLCTVKKVPADQCLRRVCASAIFVVIE